jgi:hypothetical protein
LYTKKDLNDPMLSVTIKAAMTVVPTKISSKVDVGSFLYLRRLLLSFQFSIDIYAYMIFLDQIAFLRRPAPVSPSTISVRYSIQNTVSLTLTAHPRSPLTALPACQVALFLAHAFPIASKHTALLSSPDRKRTQLSPPSSSISSRLRGWHEATCPG